LPSDQNIVSVEYNTAVGFYNRQGATDNDCTAERRPARETAEQHKESERGKSA
jgi:hypothetical protein